MKKNMGSTDRVLRTIAALIIGYLLFDGTLGGTLGIILGVVAIAFLLTSMLSFCPLYVPLKISTLKK